MKEYSQKTYFTVFEKLLWGISILLTVLAFLIFDRTNYITLIASLTGITSLIFAAKGNPAGPFLMIFFSLFYAYISYSFKYYGEMITYLGMTMPMSLFSLIAWLKNPYNESGSEVSVNHISIAEAVMSGILALIVTAVFYFILKYFDTANLIPSTVSVTTSFLAVYLTFRRSPYFALAYAANDLILIVLWILASLSDKKYISVTVCFIAFLVNDLYGFINWKKMEKRQSGGKLQR